MLGGSTNPPGPQNPTNEPQKPPNPSPRHRLSSQGHEPYPGPHRGYDNWSELPKGFWRPPKTPKPSYPSKLSEGTHTKSKLSHEGKIPSVGDPTSYPRGEPYNGSIPHTHTHYPSPPNADISPLARGKMEGERGRKASIPSASQRKFLSFREGKRKRGE